MNEFIDIFLSVWNQGVFGVNLNNVLIGIAILFIFIIFRSLFSKIVINQSSGKEVWSSGKEASFVEVWLYQ